MAEDRAWGHGDLSAWLSRFRSVGLNVFHLDPLGDPTRSLQGGQHTHDDGPATAAPSVKQKGSTHVLPPPLRLAVRFGNPSNGTHEGFINKGHCIARKNVNIHGGISRDCDVPDDNERRQCFFPRPGLLSFLAAVASWREALIPSAGRWLSETIRPHETLRAPLSSCSTDIPTAEFPPPMFRAPSAAPPFAAMSETVAPNPTRVAHPPDVHPPGRLSKGTSKAELGRCVSCRGKSKANGIQ